jgi:hypothetical protein
MLSHEDVTYVRSNYLEQLCTSRGEDVGPEVFAPTPAAR